MKVQNEPPIHLTYCLNVHPGETWEENFAAIREKALAVRAGLDREGAFGLGMRLGAAAAETLARPAALEEFRTFLGRENLYVFTINGFPWGPFHGTSVKEDVYRPDWRTPERRDYTIRLADILAELLPEGVTGSISTVPGSYKPWIRTDADVVAMVDMLADTAAHLAKLHNRTGAEITLALEPEPDCYVETTDETLAFFHGPLRDVGGAVLKNRHGFSAARAEEALARYLSVCFDAAHLAVEFEDLGETLTRLRDGGVRVGKIHLSAALRAKPTGEAVERLGEFCDPVYLHQVKARSADGAIRSYPDLPAALAAGGAADEEWRIHFHVPLFFGQFGALQSTSSLFTDAFIAAVTSGATEHLEIETYTFDVLPEDLRAADVTDSIAREYEWVLSRMFTP